LTNYLIAYTILIGESSLIFEYYKFLGLNFLKGGKDEKEKI